ncbi:hypothetical protein GCM10023116_00800 [Kistimonas scapharcae]|uniref:Uncharacterized protein n=1 Tax=Kistimonas scapharcae TaxID=1036133 RepID=A0ABP8UV93_9GAMM
MMQQGIPNISKKPYGSPRPCYEEHMQSGQLSFIKETSPEAQYSHRFSDSFYTYDVEHGTILNERKIEMADLNWFLTGFITTMGAYVASLVTVVSFTLTPLYFLSIPICAAVILVSAVVFHFYITSESSQQHAKQVLCPKTQEQAEALQCEAVVVCRKKQAEINDLQAINKSLKDDMRSVLDSDTCQSDSKCKDVAMSRSDLETQYAALLHSYLVNRDTIQALQSSLMNLEDMYQLSTETDSTGKINVKKNGTVKPEDLPQ